MKKIFLNTTLLGLMYLNISHGANAQITIDIPEAPSTVHAVYVSQSSKKVLNPSEKIDRLYNRNLQQEYVLQRMTEHTYFFQSQFYGTMFYVGEKGVLLFDPVENAGEKILKAILEVTKLPVTTIVYSHAHADHISSAPVIVEASKKAGVKVRIEPYRVCRRHFYLS
ncbi:MBL fold metallo-hydrolase [Acinetobacter baumannii]|uniref:MBL fold metallo-hydrolase n=1 Tax=Acinetobacter baumannii TaxID=470 RepID=UPI001CDBBC07|nr:MBL fold metallo-hydrolase [Acinetobacter baumannii]MCA4331672.1 MBL fold metallo-hydrolase [Acinetobacter baumannii]MDM8461355.1 MBL fold metallo-hydrolase [Acinetobacter baumannii]